MRAQGLALQGALAAAGLLAAFFVWQREPAGAPGEVVVVDASKRALQSVRYEDDKRWVELYRDAQDEEVYWVKLGEKPPPPPPPPAPPPGAEGAQDAGTLDAGALAQPVPPTPPTPPAPPPAPPRELRANEVAKKLFERFAPLRASRNLGKLEEGKLAEVGLKDTQRRLVLKLANGEQGFAVASPAGGWGSPYLKRETDGLVYLLGPSLLPDLEAASSRLVDRTLHKFDLGGFDQVTVTQGKATRTYVASGNPLQGPIALAPKDTPDKPDEFVRNWHERVFRLVPMDFLGRGEEPQGGAPEVLFRVEYQKAGKGVGELTVARTAAGEFLLRTEHTAGWAKLHSGVEPLATEAAKVAGSGS